MSASGGQLCARARFWASLRIDGELSELEGALLDAHLDALRGLRRLRGRRRGVDGGAARRSARRRAAPVSVALPASPRRRLRRRRRGRGRRRRRAARRPRRRIARDRTGGSPLRRSVGLDRRERRHARPAAPAPPDASAERAAAAARDLGRTRLASDDRDGRPERDEPHQVAQVAVGGVHAAGRECTADRRRDVRAMDRDPVAARPAARQLRLAGREREDAAAVDGAVRGAAELVGDGEAAGRRRRTGRADADGERGGARWPCRGGARASSRRAGSRSRPASSRS